jgi:hypothetical protein
LRSAAQLVSYEVPMGLALVSVLLMTRSLSLVEIVERQQRIHLWFVFPGLVAFFLYFVAGVAETNRNPFDLPEAESELVSGFNTEYSGVKFAFFFLGEYTGMIIISCVAVTVFFGGWLRPFPNVGALAFLDVVPPALWFLLDLSALPVRPVDGPRLEVDDPAFPAQHRRRGRGDPRDPGTDQRTLHALLDLRRVVRGHGASGEAAPPPRKTRAAGRGSSERRGTGLRSAWL